MGECTLYLTFYIYTFSKILYIRVCIDYGYIIVTINLLFNLYNHCSKQQQFFFTIFKSKCLLIIHYMAFYGISLLLFSFFFF